MIDASTIIDYTHEDLLEGIASIKKQIEESGKKYDFIVGVARGGAVPAVYLSHTMKLPLVLLHWSSRDNHLAFGNECNDDIPNAIYSGKKILLVDDIVDGGDTMVQILCDWEAKAGTESLKNVDIASLIYNLDQGIQVKYCHRKIFRSEDPRWVVFPWEA